MDQLGLIPEIAPRYHTTYFNHIIGGYAAGYYSYLWANVLDNDAFEAFKEHGIFDKATAEPFPPQCAGKKGDSEDPMTLYKNFRGSEPQLEPMLKKSRYEVRIVQKKSYICSLIYNRNQLKSNHNKLKVTCKTKDL